MLHTATLTQLNSVLFEIVCVCCDCCCCGSISISGDKWCDAFKEIKTTSVQMRQSHAKEKPNRTDKRNQLVFLVDISNPTFFSFIFFYLVISNFDSSKWVWCVVATLTRRLITCTKPLPNNSSKLQSKLTAKTHKIKF